PKARGVVAALRGRAIPPRAVPMLADTRGPPRTPTTAGKGFAVLDYGVERILRQVEATDYLGQRSGATRTFTAHVAAYPYQDWPAVSREYRTSLGLDWHPLTTQIESQDWQAGLYQRVGHVNRILHTLCTDVWTCISVGYFSPIPQAGATGSST